MNGKRYSTNRSINGKIDSLEDRSMQKIEISHGKQSVFLFKAFGEVGSAGKPGIKCYLSYTIALFFH
jgi:hypothetical protein